MANLRILRAALVLIPVAFSAACSSSPATKAPRGTGGKSGETGAEGGPGGTSGGGAGGATSSTALADVPGKLAAAYCATNKACLGPADPSGPNCVADETTLIRQGDFASYQAAIGKKTVTYDPTKLGACLSAISKAGCDIQTKRTSTLCAGVFTGTLASGASCTFGAECKDGLFCQVSAADGGTPACPGKCVGLLAVGGTCAISDECKDGLVCAAGACATPVAESAACGGASGAVCQPGLVCAGAPGACKKISDVFKGSAGDGCDQTTLCKAGLVCAVVAKDAMGKPTAKCEAPPSGGSDGGPAPCHFAVPEECPIGQFCELPNATTASGLCKLLPGAGQSCVSQIPSDPNSLLLCKAGAFCDPRDGTCRSPKNDGEKCTVNAECYSGICIAGSCVATLCK